MLIIKPIRKIIWGATAVVWLMGCMGEYAQGQGWPSPTDSATSIQAIHPEINNPATTIPEKIVVVDDRNYAPLTFVDRDGNPRGIIIDIWKLWSQKTGIAVEFRLMPWNSALEAVRVGDADVVASLFRTAKREEIFDFTQPFFFITTSIYFHRQIHGIQRLEDLDGFHIGVVEEDNAEEIVRKQLPTATLELYPNTEDLVAAAIAGKINVFVADTHVARYYLGKLDSQHLIREAIYPVTYNEQFAAVRKGNRQLLSILQQGLDQISKNEIRRIIDRWIGMPLFLRVPWSFLGIVLGGSAILCGAMLFLNFQLKRKIIQSTLELRQRNEELQKSERNYREIIDATQDLIFLHDAQDGRILDVNQVALDRCGYTKEQIIGRNMESLKGVSPIFNRVEAFRQIEKAASAETYIFEWHTPQANGSSLWMEVTLRSSQIGGENRVLVVIRDITKRKRAEDALRDSEAKYRLILDHSSDLIWNLNKEGIFTYVSPSWKRVTGYEPVDLMGTSFQPIVHPDDVPQCLRFIQEMNDIKDVMQSPEYRVLHGDGCWHWHIATGSPVLSPQGEFLSMVGISRDISQQKQAEENLLQEQLLMKKLLESLPGIFYLYTYPELRLVRWNKNHETLLGFTSDEILNRSIFEWHVPEAKEAVLQAVEIAMEKGLNQIEGALLAKDGHTIPFLLTGVKLEVLGQCFLMGVGIDITERKRMEAEREKLQSQLLQVQKMESVGRLAGGVAHDFNNMLGVILGHAELAINKIQPENPLYRDLSGIKKAAQRSADLTRQLLAFARKQTITPKVLDLNKAIEGMLKMLRRLIGEDIHLTWIPGKELWPVKIDPIQIDQILVNLCVNARDAIDGVGQITIETQNVLYREEDGSYSAGLVPGAFVTIVVSDSGSGMDKETQERVFEPFFTTKELGQGIGLGLATVYGILQQNNGYVNVESEVGKGTTFKILLPRYLGKALEIPDENPVSVLQKGEETVLLVEDEPMVLALGLTMLETLGYRVLTAATPGEAIRLAQDHAGPIHLLITDVVMPDMNGRDLAKRLLVQSPKLKRLFMSGYTANVIAHQGILDDDVVFLQKPFTLKDLSVKVREALNA